MDRATLGRKKSLVVGQFECNIILKGCELIAVGEPCDTHGIRSDLILTLTGSHLHRRFDPFRVNENVFIRDPWASRSSPTAAKLNPFGIPNACALQSRLNGPTTAKRRGPNCWCLQETFYSSQSPTACKCARACAVGKVIRNVVPCPGVLSTFICPECS